MSTQPLPIESQIRSYDDQIRSAIEKGSIAAFMQQHESSLSTLFAWQATHPGAFPSGLFIYKFIKTWYGADAVTRASFRFNADLVQALRAFDEKKTKKRPTPMQGVQHSQPGPPLPTPIPPPPRPTAPSAVASADAQPPAPAPKPKPKPRLIQKTKFNVAEQTPSVPAPAVTPAIRQQSGPAGASAGNNLSVVSAPDSNAPPTAYRSFADINDDSEDETYEAQPVHSDDSSKAVKQVEEGRKKERREAVGTGLAFEPACGNCSKAGRLCLEEVGEGACVSCFRLKYKCDYAHPRGVSGAARPQKRKVLVDELRQRAKPEDDSGRKDKRSRTRKGKGKAKEVEAADDSEAEMPKYVEVSDDPKPKRRKAPRKSKANEPAPAASAAPAPTFDASNLVTIPVLRNAINRSERNLLAGFEQALEEANDEEILHDFETQLQRLSRGIGILLHHSGHHDAALEVCPSLSLSLPPTSLSDFSSVPAPESTVNAPAGGEAVVLPVVTPVVPVPDAMVVPEVNISLPAVAAVSPTAAAVPSVPAPAGDLQLPLVTLQPATPQNSQEQRTTVSRRGRSRTPALTLQVPPASDVISSATPAQGTRSRARTMSPMDTGSPASTANSDQSGKKRKANDDQEERQDKRRK